jgi:polyhydroxyalkanoate synthesis regulator phasin
LTPVNTHALAQRQFAEVQAAMTVAKQFPRDEDEAIERILTACRRTGVAEASMYQFPRGGKKVVGPSIRLAEVMARGWGNIDYGVSELEQTGEESVVQTHCIDLETNTRVVKTFTVKKAYKSGGKIKQLEDPRDIYENVANAGARRVRACILAVIPPDIQDLAIEECKKTLAGSSKTPLVDRVRKMLDAFSTEFSVTKAMIEGRIGYKTSAFDENDFLTLRQIWTSMKDGMTGREDWFDVETAEKGEDLATQARKKREAEAAGKGDQEPQGAPEKPAKESKPKRTTKAAKKAEMTAEERKKLVDDTVKSIARAETKKDVDGLEAHARAILETLSDDEDMTLDSASHERIEALDAKPAEGLFD